MLATLETATLYGLDAIPITVEVDVSAGLPGMNIVGLPDKAVDEAKDRVRSALSNCGFRVPAKRITVNLAPADVKKVGAGFDLPIALGILLAEGLLDKKVLGKAWVVGELALTGTVRDVPGILPIARQAREHGIEYLFVPETNAYEAAVVDGLSVYSVPDLLTIVKQLKDELPLEPVIIDESKFMPPTYENDFAYVKGQDQAKRALEIAAAGGHNVLLSGPPGSGKTMLARCLPSILPSMSRDEQLEVSQIYSAVGLLSGGLMRERPFRSPHHTTSNIALVGGGSVPRPGEVTLAHMGILFLDELPEFPRSVLEVLRQPLEDGTVVIARAQGTVRFPARFTLIAAQNPCPCGFYSDPGRECVCTPHQLQIYQKKISGPLLDRIDLHIEVPRVPSETLADEIVAETSETIRARVTNARDRQQKRFKNSSITNASLSTRQVKTHIELTPEVKDLLKIAADQMHLSARSFYRVIKVALTIADLSNEDTILPVHIAEALQYRPAKEKA